jgi:hypothetical protein
MPYGYHIPTGQPTAYPPVYPLHYPPYPVGYPPVSQGYPAGGYPPVVVIYDDDRAGVEDDPLGLLPLWAAGGEGEEWG